MREVRKLKRKYEMDEAKHTANEKPNQKKCKANLPYRMSENHYIKCEWLLKK